MTKNQRIVFQDVSSRESTPSPEWSQESDYAAHKLVEMKFLSTEHTCDVIVFLHVISTKSL